MKLKLLVSAIGWLLVITGMHVQFNVGWEEFGDEFGRVFGDERQEMIVGFLPVT